MVVMGCHNFKDEALIKRWRASQKMNETSGKLKDENKQNNYRKLFLFSNFWCSQKYECEERD
jgi:hypothetical protein